MRVVHPNVRKFSQGRSLRTNAPRFFYQTVPRDSLPVLRHCCKSLSCPGRRRFFIWPLAAAFVLTVVGCDDAADEPAPSPAVSGSRSSRRSDSAPVQQQGSRSQLRFSDRIELPEFVPTNGEESNQYAILESLGAGVGMIDFDSDGRLDLAFAGGGKLDEDRETSGSPFALMRQTADRKFVVSRSANIAPQFYSHAVIVGERNDQIVWMVERRRSGVPFLDKSQ